MTEFLRKKTHGFKRGISFGFFYVKLVNSNILKMKKQLFIVFILSLFASNTQAQLAGSFCGTHSFSEVWENEIQRLILETKNLQKNKNQTENNYVIPVVFHVIHGGESVGTFPNILEGQIQSQMTILNQDFSGNAYNASNYPPNAFVNWAVNQNIPGLNLDLNGRIKIADFNIQFCLATKDTSGQLLPEPGIHRVNYLSLGIPNPSTYTTQSTMKAYLDNTLKPQTIWDVRKYLNVWITDKNTALTYSGVSSGPPFSGLMDLPNNATELTDGIWCYTKVVGSNALFPPGSYLSPMIDGRTLTHEAGHYVGLRHIWGDQDCGNDFCNDTPPAAGQNSGAPTYPHEAGSCASPSNNPDGEMFMNFMDYTRGPSVYMFTTDQRTRAQTAMLNSPFRNQLGTHGLCSETTDLIKTNLKNALSVYPNPAKNHLNLDVSETEPKEILIIDLFGQVLIATKNTHVVDISCLAQGVYFVTVSTGQQTYAQTFIKE